MGGLEQSIEPGLILGGRLRLEKIVASGSMGEVWRARHVGLEKDVAVKVLRTSHRDNREITQRFIREAQTASRLDHPGVVRILDFGRDDSGILYLAMELVEGPTLQQELSEEGPASLNKTIDILGQTLAVLAAAHGRGVLHRDMKPSNTLLSHEEDDDGAPITRVKVCDFGLAKLLDAGESIVGAKGPHIVGTPLYMSPEQATGGAMDARTDIYACGIMLFEMLAGYPPYSGEAPVSVLLAHCQSPIPRLIDIRPDLPREVQHVFEKAVAKDAEERFRTAREFRSALAELRKARPDAARTTTYFFQPRETAEVERVPRKPRSQRPLPPDIQGRALLDAIEIERPVEEPSATMSSTEGHPGLDDGDLDTVIPAVRTASDEETPTPTKRRLSGYPGLSDSKSRPATGFYLASATHTPTGPLRFQELCQLLRAEIQKAQSDGLRISADPYPRQWRSTERLLELIGAPRLAGADPEGAMTSWRTLGDGATRDHLGWVFGQKAEGRILVKSATDHAFFEIHIVEGRPTHIETNVIPLLGPSSWLARGVLTETDLPRMVAQAWHDEISVETATRRLTGADLDAERQPLMIQRLKAALAVDRGRWAWDPNFEPTHRKPFEPRSRAPSRPPRPLEARAVTADLPEAERE